MEKIVEFETEMAFRFFTRAIVVVKIKTESGKVYKTIYYQSTGHNSGKKGMWFPIAGLDHESSIYGKVINFPNWLLKGLFVFDEKDSTVTVIKDHVITEADHMNPEKRLTFDEAPFEAKDVSDYLSDYPPEVPEKSIQDAETANMIINYTLMHGPAKIKASDGEDEEDKI